MKGEIPKPGSKDSGKNNLIEGCTIAGLNEMHRRGFSPSLIRGLAASYNKIVKD
jgi:hypothetical protein